METTATTAGYLPLILSIAPIILLIWLMVKKNAVPSYIALPGTALIIYLLQLFYFKNDFMLLNANAAAGIVATLTPITVIFGAIFFNRMMEATGCLAVIRQWLGNINPNPIAQLMIIGWAFAFMIEGASGFGTPAAIAAPILVGLGFKPMQVAVFALVMNSVPVSFGAVGTPTWFGFGELKNTEILSDADILQIGKQTGIIHFIAGLVIPVIALRFITSWAEIRKNLGYIYLSILACTVPYALLAQVNYEFPSLVGGGIGLLLSVVLANKGIGLAKMTDSGERATLTTGQVLKALMPLGMLMIILIVTRVQELGLKGLLNDATPLFTLHLGVCDFEVSRALILSFDFENVNSRMMYNAYRRSPSFFTNSPMAAAGLPDAAETALLAPLKQHLPEAVFTQPAPVPPKSDPVLGLRPNLIAARALLLQAGYRYRNGVLTNAKGEPLVLEFLIGNKLFERVIAKWQRDLAKIGITLNARTVDASVYQKRLDNFDFDLTTAVYGQSQSPGNEQAGYFSCAAAQTPGSRNLAGLCHPAVEALLPRFGRTADRAELTTAARALDRVLRHQYIIVPNWYTDRHRVIRRAALGVPARPPKYYTPAAWALQTWWAKVK